MNGFRQFSAEREHEIVGGFQGFNPPTFLPPEKEYLLHERLWSLMQTGNLHDYVADFQNQPTQCTLHISPLEMRFYVQQGLKTATSSHLHEHHAQTLDTANGLALRFDHAGQLASGAKNNWEPKATFHRCQEPDHIAPN
eukprot:jgi/Phyca11/123008/e_gw1.49.352.1